jgi:hypothetical protein
MLGSARASRPGFDALVETNFDEIGAHETRELARRNFQRVSCDSWAEDGLLQTARQQLAKDWWKVARKKHALFASQVVLDEIAFGDKEMAARWREGDLCESIFQRKFLVADQKNNGLALVFLL